MDFVLTPVIIPLSVDDEFIITIRFMLKVRAVPVRAVSAIAVLVRAVVVRAVSVSVEV